MNNFDIDTMVMITINEDLCGKVSQFQMERLCLNASLLDITSLECLLMRIDVKIVKL